MATESANLERYLKGLNSPEPPQPRTGKDGDPQLAALHQLLLDYSHLTSSDSIVDIGSGSGLLADVIGRVWANTKPPQYIAVDLQQPLDNLSLPTSIHNTSKKVEFKAFFDGSADIVIQPPALAIIRNVFHELDIEESAYLLRGLNSQFRKTAGIYIQDMQRLPKAERRNAGWHADCFGEMLRRLGMPARLYDLASHSGIPWFAVTTNSTEAPFPQKEIAKICAEQRRAQTKIMMQQIASLNKDYSSATAEAVQILSFEHSSIEQQLGAYEQSMGQPHAKDTLAFEELSLPLHSSSEQQALSISDDPKAFSQQTGIVGALRTKDILDVAALIQTANSNVWFAGYSNRLTFEKTENRNALAHVLARGVDCRVILSDPESGAAAIRADQPVYDDPSELIREIRSTIDLAKSFLSDEYAKISLASRGPFGLRLTRSMACTRFRRHRVRCFDGAGGASWRGGSLRGSSSLKRCA